MTGPEHYREAERLVAKVLDRNGDLLTAEDDADPAWVAGELARAQVHATLALAAATALTGYLSTETTTTDELAWTKAANNNLGVLA